MGTHWIHSMDEVYIAATVDGTSCTLIALGKGRGRANAEIVHHVFVSHITATLYFIIMRRSNVAIDSKLNLPFVTKTFPESYRFPIN